MMYLYTILIASVFSLLWRIRGGLWKEYIPANKVWFSVAFAIYSLFYFDPTVENFLVGFIACYTSYQLYGWGLYIGRLLDGSPIDPEKDKECELIDDILFSARLTMKGHTVYLYQYPKVFGFCGVTMTGLIITFLLGLFLGNIWVMLWGLGMGVCYWLGGKLEKLLALGKGGWNWGEIIFGFYLGVKLAVEVL